MISRKILHHTSTDIHVYQESNKFPLCSIDSNSNSYDQLWKVMKSYEKLSKVTDSSYNQLWSVMKRYKYLYLDITGYNWV